MGSTSVSGAAESFFSTLKFEIRTDVDLDGRSTAAQLIKAITDYIRYFNNQRLHSTIDYMPPTEFEQLHQNAMSTHAEAP
jgi:transposase InsO family protein